MRRSRRARRLAFRLPPYDIPRVAPRNTPKFHVDRAYAAGGVCEQTKTALRKYRYRLPYYGILQLALYILFIYITLHYYGILQLALYII